MMPFRFAVLFLVLASAVAAAAPQRAVRIVSPRAEYSVPALEEASVLYFSLSEVARREAFAVTTDNARDKMEIRIGGLRLKVTAGNPFIVLVDAASNTVSSVEQLPVPALGRDNAWYVPLRSFLPVWALAWKRSLRASDDGEAILIDNAIPAAPLRTSASGAAASGATASGAAASGAAAKDADRASPATAAASGGDAELLAPRSIAEEAASGSDITHMTIDTRKNGTLVRIHSRKPLAGFRKEQIGRYLRVTIPHVRVDAEELRQTALAGDDIRGIDAAQDDTAARIDFELGDRVASTSLTKDAGSADLFVTLFSGAAVERIYQDEQERQDGKKQSDAARSTWSLDCIVIDPGHGGRDPGAVGLTGLKEKNINLGIALKLGALIESGMKGVRVVYTRRDDTFIELDRRGRIANEHEGKLFISIHCNSTEKKPTTARGMEVYLLRPGRTQEAIRIAEFENSVIKLEKDYERRYRKLTDENFILVAIAQSAYVKHSERFAELVHDQARASAKIRSLGVKQAGFYVLVGASMPSVLVETGFLSNARDEAFLATQEGQHHYARLLYQAVTEFAREYEKRMKE